MKISKEYDEWLSTGNFGENDPGPITTGETTQTTVLRENQTHAKTDEVKPKASNKFIKGLKKLDGQGEDGKGKGGRLAGAASAISKFQGYREASKWKGDENPDPVRGGESKNPYTVTDEGYAGSRMKTGEGPQTTLLRDIDVETGKKKKKNKNYEDY